MPLFGIKLLSGCVSHKKPKQNGNKGVEPILHCEFVGDKEGKLETIVGTLVGGVLGAFEGNKLTNAGV